MQLAARPNDFSFYTFQSPKVARRQNTAMERKKKKDQDKKHWAAEKQGENSKVCWPVSLLECQILAKQWEKKEATDPWLKRHIKPRSGVKGVG